MKTQTKALSLIVFLGSTVYGTVMFSPSAQQMLSTAACGVCYVSTQVTTGIGQAVSYVYNSLPPALDIVVVPNNDLIYTRYHMNVPTIEGEISRLLGLSYLKKDIRKKIDYVSSALLFAQNVRMEHNALKENSMVMDNETPQDPAVQVMKYLDGRITSIEMILKELRENIYVNP
jgi:hypothetical protein